MMVKPASPFIILFTLGELLLWTVSDDSLVQCPRRNKCTCPEDPVTALYVDPSGHFYYI